MRGRRIARIAMGILICMAFAYSAFAYPAYPTVYPTGTTIYKPDKCWNGYTLIAPQSGPVFLIDMNGNVVHRWDVMTSRARLLPNGHLVIFGGGFSIFEKEGIAPKVKKYLQIKNRERKIFEYDWESNLVWEYEAPGAIHHDVQRLSNGNTIFLYIEIVPEEYMKLVKDPERKAVKLYGSCIREVNPKGEVVWEWHEYKHLDLNIYSPINALSDWTHTNTVQVLPENHWYNEGYKEFKPGNVLINQRHFNTCIIVDRDTKEVVWTYTGNYVGGLAQPHEPHMIEPGLPGAGNILIFDNGSGARNSAHDGKSFVLEINPVAKEIVWNYKEGLTNWEGTKFFSKYRGSQQRLPNGNTLIDEDNTGRTFEVTPEKEIVWEYVAPPFQNYRPISRPERYPYDYCSQLKALPKPRELTVTPPKYKDYHLLPDILR